MATSHSRRVCTPCFNVALQSTCLDVQTKFTVCVVLSSIPDYVAYLSWNYDLRADYIAFFTVEMMMWEL